MEKQLYFVYLSFLFIYLPTFLTGQCDVQGGALTTEDTMEKEVTICSGDGITDPIWPWIMNDQGDRKAWIITNEDGLILEIPKITPFEMEGKPAGICKIYHVSYNSVLFGLSVDHNIDSLEGCFALSNPITVNKIEVSGGEIMLPDTTTQITICAEDGEADPLDVLIDEIIGDNSQWVITDTAQNILSLPDQPPFNLEGAGSGICLIWNIAYLDELLNLKEGVNFSNLIGCYSLSNPIRVIRLTGRDCRVLCPNEGGKIVTGNNQTDVSICIGDLEKDILEVDLSNEQGSNSRWIITDSLGNVIALPDDPPFDLSNLQVGVSEIYHLSFEEDLIGLEIGSDLDELDGCYDLSNPITITTTQVDGGTIATSFETTEISLCVGDGNPDVFSVDLSGNIGDQSIFLVTDTLGNILALQESNQFDFENSPTGVCQIWHLSLSGTGNPLSTDENIDHLEGCIDLSNPIKVIKNTVEGGKITIDGAADTILCLGDTIPDEITVEVMDQIGQVFYWVVTDTLGTVLDISYTEVISFKDATPGIYQIWHISSLDSLPNLMPGITLETISGCVNTSNSIRVDVVELDDCPGVCIVDGGMLQLPDGKLGSSICTSDSILNTLDILLQNTHADSTKWVVTDTSGTIISISDSLDVDLKILSPGICLIWHLSYKDSILHLNEGQNKAQIEGCFDFSNPIRIQKDSVNGGLLTLIDGPTETTICTGDSLPDALEVTLIDQFGPLSSWIITDTLGEILALPMAPPFDLEGADPGVCQIWHLSHSDTLINVDIGKSLSGIMGCFNFSNPITVIRDSSAAVCQTSSLESFRIDHRLTIHPNPTSGWIKLRLQVPHLIKTTFIQVLNLMGQVYFEQTFPASFNNEFELDLSNLPNGTYFVTVRGGDINTAQKIVIR